MADQRNGGIAWCDETWNPIRGCSRVSEGCRNCYAEAMAARFCGVDQPYEGTINPATKRWSGNTKMVHDKLEEPLHWTRPRRIFVNSMSDLFHPEVPDEFIDKVFAVMALCPQHTFQVLTKRPERMLDYLRSSSVRDKWVSAGDAIAYTIDPQHYANISHSRAPGNNESVFSQWPLHNVWLGVTVENQQSADERIPLLLQTPAAIRWVSMEPLLGCVDLERVLWPGKESHRVDVLRGGYWCKAPHLLGAPSADIGDPRGGFVNHSDMPATLDWIVVGGESGRNARPVHPDWVRSIRDQCKAAGIPYLFKQWGEWVGASHRSGERGTTSAATLQDEFWPESDTIKQKLWGDRLEAHSMSFRVGKKAAGRLLDGVLHDGYPEVLP